MRLHETPIQDPGFGFQQIHAQIQSLCLEMQSLKQDKVPQSEVHEEVWCIKCKGQGHDKDHCLTVPNYLVGGTNAIVTRGTSGAKRGAHTLVRDLSSGRKACHRQLSSIVETDTTPPTTILQFL